MVITVGIAALYTSGMVIIARNPVSSVIYLVGTIVNGGMIFMMLGINIIPLIYVIVYVGGISILFLFVIMMVDLHLFNFKERRGGLEGGVGLISSIAVVIITVMVYVSGLTVIQGVREGGVGLGSIYKEGKESILPVVSGMVKVGEVEVGYRGMRWENSIMTLEMIKSIGYILYSENIMALIVIGFVLLMVMMSLRLLLKGLN